MPIISTNPVTVAATVEKTYNIIWYDNINIQAFDKGVGGKTRASITLSKVMENPDGSYETAPRHPPKSGGTMIIDDVDTLVKEFETLPITFIIDEKGNKLTGFQAVVAALLAVIKIKAEKEGII